ncbi:MAG: hypothetical protein KDB00_10950 [Planctomycetales bacterium]|nr:hypothetical protein [Planctomycetales bacterium]
MFLRQIRNLAGDCKRTHRWCLVNLTGDDANANRREKLEQRRIIGVGRKYVRLLANNGSIDNVDPFLIQRVW